MTLPEVLVSVTVTGILVAAMATATSVLLAQADNSTGRINNARSEQSIGIWLPPDLASAEDVNTDPGASPCGTDCPPHVNVSGSNTIMLTWSGTIAGETQPIPTQTNVSYRYIQAADGEWQMLRVHCYSVDSAPPTCSQNIVLHDLAPPPVGVEYYAGITKPEWVMLVTLAIDPADPGDGSGGTAQDPTYYVKNGRRVTVIINGGGNLAGAGGGADSITLSAGGTNRETDLGTTNLSAAPTFAATRSRCGGNFGLIVDTSGSIGSTNMASVRTGVTAFINAFAGTPVRLQVVSFATNANTLGAGAAWTKYYDLLVESDVNALKSLVTGLNSTGGTNWEDGLFRMFRNSDGTVQSTLPSTLIFFTDGIPTYSRLNSTSASVPAVPFPGDSGLPNANGSSYNQVSWNRANRVAREFEVDLERLIGVYVGSNVSGQSTWLTQGSGYHLENFIRGFHIGYERGWHVDGWERGYNLTYERANKGVRYEKKQGNSWKATSRSSYELNNAFPGDSDGWRVRVTGSLSDWTTTYLDNYTKSNLTADSTDGFRAVKSYSSPYAFWEPTTQSSYNSNNTTSDGSDGWRIIYDYSAPFTEWTETTKSTYDANNTTPDESDGWRAPKDYSSPYSLWESTTEADYNANNTSWGTSDGYDATKVYSEPYTFHENTSSSLRPNRDILKQFVAPGGVVPAVQSDGAYTNASEATYYELPIWSQFSNAMTSLALAECGGTVTLQTKIGASNAADPFTYQSSVDLTTATTSSQFRSGTFDYDLSGGGTVQVDIAPLDTDTLANYSHVGWTCKSGGADYPFVTTPIDGGPWTRLTLTVAPNTAISCTNQVSLL